MTRFGVVALICCSLVVDRASTEHDEEEQTGAARLYRTGVDAYLANRWQLCVDSLEAAIRRHRTENGAVARCRRFCAREEFEPSEKVDVEDLHFYEKAVKRTLCFLRCKRENYPDLVFDDTADEDALRDIDDLEPYNYLQLCYLQVHDNQAAASAAFTYLVRHPDRALVRSNMENYLKLPDVVHSEIVNREAPDHVAFYVDGQNAYDARDWIRTATLMEEALQEYLEAEDECRSLCEGPFDQGWLPDLTASIANHFTRALRCKQDCPQTLAHFDGLHGHKLLSDIYNYLQFAYYQLGRIPEACRAVASRLVIEPADEDMHHNRNLYGCQNEDPRSEVVKYATKIRYENKILKFIDEHFTAEIEYEKFNAEERAKKFGGRSEESVEQADAKKESNEQKDSKDSGEQTNNIERESKDRGDVEKESIEKSNRVKQYTDVSNKDLNSKERTNDESYKLPEGTIDNFI